MLSALNSANHKPDARLEQRDEQHEGQSGRQHIPNVAADLSATFCRLGDPENCPYFLTLPAPLGSLLSPGAIIRKANHRYFYL